jgi:hypothetical protein
VPEAWLGSLPEGASRDISLQSLLQVLETRFTEGVGHEVRIEEADLYALVGSERDAAIDALVAGRDLPIIIVAGEVSCAGDLDVARILDALTTEAAGVRREEVR